MALPYGKRKSVSNFQSVTALKPWNFLNLIFTMSRPKPPGGMKIISSKERKLHSWDGICYQFTLLRGNDDEFKDYLTVLIFDE